MSLFDDYKIIPNSTNGDKIVSRDFNTSDIVFRIEIITLTDSDFYRDGKNSCMEYLIKTNMFIITKIDSDFIIHIYYAVSLL
jgi:hypothetical protein